MNLSHQKTKEVWCSFIHLNHLHLFGSTTSSPFLLFCRFQIFLRFERIEIPEKMRRMTSLRKLSKSNPLINRGSKGTLLYSKLSAGNTPCLRIYMQFWIRKSNIIEEDEDLSASQDLADFIENERQIKQGMIFIKIIMTSVESLIKVSCVFRHREDAPRVLTKSTRISFLVRTSGTVKVHA